MKRFISALALSVSLLVLLTLFLFPPARATAAKENVIMKLLNLPAPPPPNPLVQGQRRRDEKFYDRNNPPDDNAPIEDLIDYWTNQTGAYRGDNFNINFKRQPSGRTLDRLMAEMVNKPELATQLLDVLPNDKSVIEAVKDLYDRAGTDGGVNRDEGKRLRDWLRYNSPYFSRDLERVSQQIKDENNYVSQANENNLLALTRYDFDKASPIINQLYGDFSQPASRALATWALYRRALETDSLSDIERYRSELMRMVEDRSQSEGVRDKANDALMLERDFPGREDWAISLFEDETFVAITRYTAATTLIRRSSPEKYVPKLIALLQKTSNPTVRAAAVRNLVVALNGNPGQELEIEIIKALLPWLEDPKWAADVPDSRAQIVRKLSEYQIPESVPGLINMLDEKERQSVCEHGRSKCQPIQPRMRSLWQQIPFGRRPMPIQLKRRLARRFISIRIVKLPFRHLESKRTVARFQRLRRVLNELNGYERSIAVKAILDCGGFTVVEQMAALEAAAKRSNEQEAVSAAIAGGLIVKCCPS